MPIIMILNMGKWYFDFGRLDHPYDYAPYEGPQRAVESELREMKSSASLGRYWVWTEEKGKAMSISPTISKWLTMPRIFVPFN